MTDYPLFDSFGGEIKKVRRYIDPENKNWSAFNPSIACSPDGKLSMFIRSSNYVVTKNAAYVVTEGNKIQNRTYLCDLTDDLEIENIRRINYSEVPFQDTDLKIIRGPEDAKGYWRNGSLEFTAVMKEPNGIPIPRLTRFQLVGNRAEFIDLNGFIGEDKQRAEKNWMATYTVNPTFEYVYSPTQVIKDRELITVRDLTEEIRGVRGGSNLWDLNDCTYLAIVHKTMADKFQYYDPNRFGVVSSEKRNYEHRFARYDCEGRLFQLSDPFQFIGYGIEFAAGLVIVGEDVLVSFGKNDASSYLAKISFSKVMSMLRYV